MGRTAAQILRELREASEQVVRHADRGGIKAEYAKLDRAVRNRRMTPVDEETGREIEKIFRTTKKGVSQ